MRRFYREVTVEPGEAPVAVLLDGRPLKTPARQALRLPTRPLAEAVAAEWAAQGEQITPPTMPLTRLAVTATDLMPARRADAIEEVVGYAATELLCYRAVSPADLAARQHERWQPWLDWLVATRGARLELVRSLDPCPQPEASLLALRAAVEAVADWPLVGLHAAVTATGSLVLGLALLDGALDAAEAFALAQLDELYQIERWGEEREQQRRHAALRRDLATAARFLRLLEGRVSVDA
ncbi:MAG: ATP12 family protein [Geminicoccaceae bacterium]|nr:ATPase [Geminicoccaceae bacterium]MDW8371076.1 ATP12 family protein [Geminicoccaceae bacterium]